MRTKILILFLLLLLTPGLHSATIYIPADYTTIQAGLDAAQTGDTVMVAPGVYFENLIWPYTHNIKLLSELGADSTIIDGSSIDRVIEIDGMLNASTIIDGFTLQNGFANPAQGVYPDGFGGGISLKHGASPTIRNNIIQNCTAINDAMNDGGGAGIGTRGTIATNVHIEGNIIQNNTVIDEAQKSHCYGAGIYIGRSGDVYILDNLIIENDIFPSGGNGGGIYIEGGTATITGNEFFGNVAYSGAALYLDFNPPVDADVSECLFEGNISSASPSYNSCIKSVGGGLTLSNSSIVNNYSTGLLVSAGSADTVEVFSCTIAGNSFDGIRVSSDGVTSVHNCSIFDNDYYGIVNDYSGNEVDATYCWWGDPSGPGGAGPGTGDQVTGNVLYDPWLTEMGIGDASPSSRLRLSVFPNPFTSDAIICFELYNAGLVTIRVYDLSGRLVEQVADCMLERSEHTIELDGSEWSPGIYLIYLNTENISTSHRCLLVRE